MGTHLTDTEVKNARLPDGKAEHNISDLTGLYLRLRLGASSVSKTWRYRYTHEGSSRWMVLGTYPNMSLAAAREALFEQQKVLGSGIDPKLAKEIDVSRKEADAAMQRLGAAPETLDDLFNQFLEKYARKQYKSKGADQERTYKNHIGSHLGSVRLEHLTTSAFSNLLHKVSLKAGDASYSKSHARTVGVVLDLLKRVFSWGYESGIIETNPVAAIKAKNVGASKGEMGERVLSSEELTELVHKLDYADMATKWKSMAWLMLSCLTRVEETSLAEVKHIDLKNRLWLIPKENQKKTRKDKPNDHYVELSPFALEHIEARLADAAQRKAVAERTGKDSTKFGIYLFPSRKVSSGEEHCNEKTATHQFSDRQQDPAAPPIPKEKRRTQESSELLLPGGKWSSHDLRRTGGTVMRNCKIDKDTVERCLNHVVGTRMERTYQKPEVLADMKNGWLALGNRLSEIVNNARADTVKSNSYRDMAMKKKDKKYTTQAEKMKETKAKNIAIKLKSQKQRVRNA
jgi:integrase